MRLRRLILSGGGEDADQTLTSTFLGVMLANKRITRSEYDAGCRYAWLFGVLFGKTGPAGSRYGEQAGGGKDHDEKWLADRTAEYRAVAARLLTLGRRHKEAVDNVCIYDRWPKWAAAAVRVAKPSTIRASDLEKRREFEAAIIELAELFGFQKSDQRKVAA
jgi:hypothetical protein